MLEDIDEQFDNFKLKNRTIVKILRKPCQGNRRRSAKVDIIPMDDNGRY
jgi:hypothetical protein